MLKGIAPCISPELLKVLCEMGHGEEIVLADANFPSESVGQKVVRADGIGAVELLSAILPMFPLDQYDDSNFVLMGVVPGDLVVPEIWNQYDEILKKSEPDAKIKYLERFAYYERAKKYLPNGGCGVVSFGLKGGRDVSVAFMDKLKLAAIVTHVADARTCVLHPASHTHRQMTEEQLKEAGVAPDLIRFSVGIEDAADIIADLEQALAQI